MLDAALKTQLKSHFNRLQKLIERLASVDDSAQSKALLALLQDNSLVEPQSEPGQERPTRRPADAGHRAGPESRRLKKASPAGQSQSRLFAGVCGHPDKGACSRI